MSEGEDKTALILLAEGAEEMEVVITADVLTRGGVKVKLAGISGPDPVVCARGTRILPDVALEDVKEKQYDLIVLPGGQPGSNTLAASELVGTMLRAQNEANRLIGAICAAPIALKAHGIQVEQLTSHQSVKAQLQNAGFAYSDERVVVSGSVITSRGPGTAFEFALKLVELLVSKEKAASLVEPLVLKL
ncbi:unnamed protein product [Caenorhabditis auriculariae]|uniref:D-lactate dehydratase n=1 Tax=Caenorhabditis auriculariae TaxID=2777116 RepID=A0A8S1HBH7_9PELO|nr:unnamed protein product [Caenorhabditis auriculariae]